MGFHVDGLYWDNRAEAEAAAAKQKRRTFLLWCDGDMNWDMWDGQEGGLYQVTDKSLERVLDDEGNWLYIA